MANATLIRPAAVLLGLLLAVAALGSGTRTAHAAETGGEQHLEGSTETSSMVIEREPDGTTTTTVNGGEQGASDVAAAEAGDEQHEGSTETSSMVIERQPDGTATTTVHGTVVAPEEQTAQTAPATTQELEPAGGDAEAGTADPEVSTEAAWTPPAPADPVRTLHSPDRLVDEVVAGSEAGPTETVVAAGTTEVLGVSFSRPAAGGPAAPASSGAPVAPVALLAAGLLVLLGGALALAGRSRRSLQPC